MIHVASLLHDDVIDNAGESNLFAASWHVPGGHTVLVSACMSCLIQHLNVD